MERIYTIPLRRGTMTAPRTRRAKKAMFVLGGFIKKHMKCDDYKVSEKLNLHIWSQGMRNPIMKVKVIVAKDEKSGEVSVRLFGEEVVAAKVKKAKVVKANTPMEKLQEKEAGLKKPVAPKTESTPKEEPAKNVADTEVKVKPEAKVEQPKAEAKAETKKEA